MSTHLKNRKINNNNATPVQSETEIPITIPVQSCVSYGEKVEYKFVPIAHNYSGGIPAGYELVEITDGDVGDAMVLYGFDEMFPIAGVTYGFLRLI